MKIVVFSDSHGKVYDMLEVTRYENPDLIFHLGDVTKDADDLRSLVGVRVSIFNVAGNNDMFTSNLPSQKVINTCDINVFVCHGHNLGVRKGISNLFDVCTQNNCAVALFGHTHKSFYEFINGIHILNPGSITIPYNDERPSYGIVEISNLSISCCIKSV